MFSKNHRNNNSHFKNLNICIKHENPQSKPSECEKYENYESHITNTSCMSNIQKTSLDIFDISSQT